MLYTNKYLKRSDIPSSHYVAISQDPVSQETALSADITNPNLTLNFDCALCSPQKSGVVVTTLKVN